MSGEIRIIGDTMIDRIANSLRDIEQSLSGIDSTLRSLVEAMELREGSPVEAEDPYQDDEEDDEDEPEDEEEE